MGPEILECLPGMLEHPRLPTGLARRHRGRQVDDPPWIGRKAAHDLQGCSGVFLTHRDCARQPGFDLPLARDVVKVEHIVVLLLQRQWGKLLCGEEGLLRLGVLRMSED